MMEAGEYECKLLADLLQTCLTIADYFAESQDVEAVKARTGTDASTFHKNVFYEFSRLNATQYVTDDGSSAVPSIGVIPLLQMLESRTPRPLLRPTWLRKDTFEGLELLRSKLCGKSLDITKSRQLLRLNTSSPKTRKYIIRCLINCNPEAPPPLEIFHLQENRNKATHTQPLKSPLVKVSRLAARSHQLLCENWACSCVPIGSHSTAKLLLTTYRSNKLTNTIRFELLLSTSDERYPWQETEIDVATDFASSMEHGEEFSETEGMESVTIHSPKMQTHKVRFAAEIPVPKKSKPRWKVKICQYISTILGSRCRLLVEDNYLWHLTPVAPKIKDLRRYTHISLSDLIQNGHFQRISQKDRFRLSYIIASSILCLYQGPWLDHAWTKDHIFFLSKSEDATAVDLSRPLLFTKFVTSEYRSSQPRPDSIHPEPRIAALGIVMLEIALGLAIESKRDDGPFNSNTDLLNAYSLLDEFRNGGNVFSKHVSAIKTCLQPEAIFDEDFKDESSQKILHDNIVGPLEVILTAYDIQVEDLNSALGVDQNLPSPSPSPSPAPSSAPVLRPSPRTRNPSMTSIQSVVMPFSIDFGLGSFSSIEKKKSLDSRAADKWFEDLETYVHPLVSEEPRRKVRIGILDSGIDLPEEIQHAFGTRVAGYRSWVEGDDIDMTDTHGHGTHAAGLLLQVSPHAEIYVARVTPDGELNPDIIAEAIKHATDVWNVDIITMSFGFSELEPVIDDALKHAAAKDTILLAAASNSGTRHSITWPARSDQVICIHSLHGNGDRSSFTPNSRQQDYAILGEAVSSYWPPHFNAGIMALGTGTSCAAPIAAGVAAILLEYGQQKLPLYARANSKVDEHVMRRLRSNAGMRMAFGLMVEHRDGQNCIIPWSLLNYEEKEYRICDSILDRLRKM